MRNNSFRQTFYLGLLILILLSGLLTIISVNVYNSFSKKLKNTNVEDTTEVNIEDMSMRIHDTVYLEKPINKDTSKVIQVDRVKPTPSNVVKKLDTTKSLDTIN
jgi:ABC-type lipoprotein release transport system permease subunit